MFPEDASVISPSNGGHREHRSAEKSHHHAARSGPKESVDQPATGPPFDPDRDPRRTLHEAWVTALPSTRPRHAAGRGWGSIPSCRSCTALFFRPPSALTKIDINTTLPRLLRVFGYRTKKPASLGVTRVRKGNLKEVETWSPEHEHHTSKRDLRYIWEHQPLLRGYIWLIRQSFPIRQPSRSFIASHFPSYRVSTLHPQLRPQASRLIRRPPMFARPSH